MLKLHNKTKPFLAREVTHTPNLSQIRCNRTSWGGFTLIELLVVISIISLLSTVIFAVFSTSRVQAQDAKKKEEVHQVNNALELYHSNENSYPANFCTDANCTSPRTFPALSSATPGSGQTQNDYQKSMQQLVTAGVLASIPEDSSATAPFAYYNTGGSAVFFTQLTNGSGGAGTNQYYPALTLDNRGFYRENSSTSDCNTWYYDYALLSDVQMKCLIVNDYGNGNADFYAYSYYPSFPAPLCYQSSTYTDGYKECLLIGVDEYSIKMTGTESSATSCANLMWNHFDPNTNSIMPIVKLGHIYEAVLCPTQTPNFCNVSDYEGGNPPTAYCYWSQ